MLGLLLKSCLCVVQKINKLWWRWLVPAKSTVYKGTCIFRTSYIEETVYVLLQFYLFKTCSLIDVFILKKKYSSYYLPTKVLSIPPCISQEIREKQNPVVLHQLKLKALYIQGLLGDMHIKYTFCGKYQLELLALNFTAFEALFLSNKCFLFHRVELTRDSVPCNVFKLFAVCVIRTTVSHNEKCSFTLILFISKIQNFPY